MRNAAALWLLITSITSICLAVVSAAISWSVGFRCTRALKSLRAQLRTPPSDAKLAQLAADQAECFSALEKLATTTKRLSSRKGMQDVRARQANDPPPIGAPKSELRRHYGITGRSPAEIVQLHKGPNNDGDNE
jgi:hypothetical protein